MIDRPGVKWRALFRLPWSWWGPVLDLGTGGTGQRRWFRRHNAGPDSYVDPTVQIFGHRNVVIGRNSSIGEYTVLNASSRGIRQDRIMIGNNCLIGRRNYFSTGGFIAIDDYAFTGIDCMFLGAGHITEDPFVPYVAAGLTVGAPIIVQANCWLTTAVTVHEGVTIGRGSIIGAGSVVNRDIPPFSIAVGNPAQVRKRFDFVAQRWIDAKEWTQAHETSIPSEADYLASLQKTHPELAPALHGSSRRFGWL